MDAQTPSQTTRLSPWQRLLGLALMASTLTASAATHKPLPKTRHHPHVSVRRTPEMRIPQAVVPIVLSPEDDEASRTLNLFNQKTKERLSVTYKQDGEYVDSALDELNYFMRDFRQDEVKPMDPQAFDILYDLAKHFNVTKPIIILSGFRTEETQAEIYERSVRMHKNPANVQVAKPGNSQHGLGNAIDFVLPGVGAPQIFKYASAILPGGLGLYVVGNFVHIDTYTEEPRGHPRRWIELPERPHKTNGHKNHGHS